MGRKVMAIVMGYGVMFVLVMATFSVAYAVLGANRSFRPGTYDVTGVWIVVSSVLSLVAAVAGGFTAAVVGRDRRVGNLLAIVVVILGVILSIPTLNAPKTDEVRTGEVVNAEAMMKARQPVAVTLVTPVIGALGVLVGARARRTPPPAPAGTP